MIEAAECGEIRPALGVYVVGAIDPADRSAVDTHLAGCSDCRSELAGLAGLHALLGRVPAHEAALLLRDSAGPAPLAQQPLQSLLGRAARLRRHSLWPRLAAAAAAGLLIGGGAIAASRVLDPSQGRPPAAAAQRRTTEVHGSNPSTHASAAVRYVTQPWGLELDVQVRGIPAGTRCELQITTARGQGVGSGSWTVASGHQSAWYPASSSVPLASVRDFVISSGARTLVSVPIR